MNREEIIDASILLQIYDALKAPGAKKFIDYKTFYEKKIMRVNVRIEYMKFFGYNYDGWKEYKKELKIKLARY